MRGPPTTLIDTEADLARGLRKLLAADARLRPVAKRAGPLPLRRREGGYAGLASIVVSQQLSTASAAAIFGRLTQAVAPLTPESIEGARDAALLGVGLSAGKVRTLRAVAAACQSGALSFEALETLPADDAHAVLTAVKGIGPWTADIYLLFCLGHADAWPAGDLALQEAARIAFDLPHRPSTKELEVVAEPWRPWRGVAARLLWSFYRVVKSRDPVPV